MAWLWDSWQEYVDAVHPCLADRPGIWRLAQRDSWFETEGHLWEQLRKLIEARQVLHELGYTGTHHQRPPADLASIAKAKTVAMDAIYAGEMLLLYHKRLAQSDASYGFLHQNDLLEHWDRYEKAERIALELHQLATDIDELLQGYNALVKAEERFIVGGLTLPPILESDFRTSRNLFSIGFDEVGLLIAGRGLEGVLRKIAFTRKICVEVKAKASPLWEADMYDLIEAMYHIRWKTKGSRLIDNETRLLLHYLRALRNGGAHPEIQGTRSMGNPRETAVVVAQTANRLWKEALTRAQIALLTVQKSW